MLISLASTQSMQVSLRAVHNGTAGLTARRASMLRRVPRTGDWARFEKDSLMPRDLAYLTAKTGHEFTILRSKRADILFHGDATHCHFDDVLADLLLGKKLMIYCHSHLGEIIPIPSAEDRQTLKRIGQAKSKLVSGISGYEIDFDQDVFSDI